MYVREKMEGTGGDKRLLWNACLQMAHNRTQHTMYMHTQTLDSYPIKNEQKINWTFSVLVYIFANPSSPCAPKQ